MDKIRIYTDRDDPSPAALKGYFAHVMASLDENPREVMVVLDVHNDRGALVSIDFEEGEPVFKIQGRTNSKADFRKRWLPEHPVPLVLPEYGRTKFVFTPTDGNRVKVRLATFWERLFA